MNFLIKGGSNMTILNIEDSIYKHHDICKALKTNGFSKATILHETNLMDALACIEESKKSTEKIDLIITDMFYPREAGGDDNPSGDELIEIAKEKGWWIPIIVCSSVQFRHLQVEGCVKYSNNDNWEKELIDLVKQVLPVID